MIDLAGELRDLRNLVLRPHERLIETWQMETGISTLRWTLTDPAAGPWQRGIGSVARHLVAYCTPAANQTARMRSNQMWLTYTTVESNLIMRKMVLEFGMRLGTVANLDNTICFFGLMPTAAAVRTTQNIVGFALTGDALQTVSDLAGAETTNTGFGETLSNYNKFKIEIQGRGVATNYAYFYLNGTLIATHITNVPVGPCYLNWYFDTEGTGACVCELGVIGAYYEESVR